MRYVGVTLLIVGLVLVSGGCKSTTEPDTPTQTKYTLTVTVSPTNGGTVAISPSQSEYPSGTVVTLTANAAAGYQFARWEGGVTGAANPTSVTMNSNVAVTAVFSASSSQYTLTVIASPANGGTVLVSPNQSQYASGTVVTLTASPASGYQFARWEGDVTGMASPITVTMNANKTVTAVFTATTTTPRIVLSASSLTFSSTGANPAPQTVNITNGGGGTLSGLGASISYAGGQTAGWLTATLSGTTAPAMLTVTADKGTLTSGTYNATISVTSGVAGNSPQPIAVTFTVSASSLQPPGISAPATAMAGTPYTVTVSYGSWPIIASNFDRLELEESVSPGSGFQLLANSPYGQHPTTFPTNVTKTQQGTYYYRARVNIYGTFSAYSSTVPVTVQAAASRTRFINSTSYPIISLRIDNVEQFPSYPQGILPGYYYEVQANPGYHSYRAANGGYDGGSKFEMYVYSGSYTQPSGSTYSITFPDPTINQLLTAFDVSRYWSGDFWDGLTPHTAAFRFYSGGNWTFYVDGAQRSTGTYYLVSRNPAGFTVTFSVGDNQGTLFELGGYFTMRNGPASWPLIQYYNQNKR